MGGFCCWLLLFLKGRGGDGEGRGWAVLFLQIFLYLLGMMGNFMGVECDR